MGHRPFAPIAAVAVAVMSLTSCSSTPAVDTAGCPADIPDLIDGGVGTVADDEVSGLVDDLVELGFEAPDVAMGGLVFYVGPTDDYATRCAVWKLVHDKPILLVFDDDNLNDHIVSGPLGGDDVVVEVVGFGPADVVLLMLPGLVGGFGLGWWLGRRARRPVIPGGR